MNIERKIDDLEVHITQDEIKRAIKRDLKLYAEYENAEYDSFKYHMKMWAKGRVDAHCALLGLDLEEVYGAGDHLG